MPSAAFSRAASCEATVLSSCWRVVDTRAYSAVLCVMALLLVVLLAPWLLAADAAPGPVLLADEALRPASSSSLTVLLSRSSPSGVGRALHFTFQTRWPIRLA